MSQATLLVAAGQPNMLVVRNWPFYSLLALTALGTLGFLHFVFYRVPNEATMGFVYKIFYFHAPSGYGMYLGATVCLIGSAFYLFNGSRIADAIAQAGGEIAVLMGAILLTSGPLWGKKAWGYYWAWDPRLTTSLLCVLIYISYVILRAFSGGGSPERKFAAALGILGSATIPIIHLSVRKWGGTHPEVITGKGGGLSHPDMKLALGLGFVVITLICATVIWLRARQELVSIRFEEAEEEALALGIVED